MGQMILPHQAKTVIFEQYGNRVRGVVHVGAHEGQEIPWYLYNGNAPVLAIEPNPEIVEVLKQRYGHEPRVKVLNFALGETEGWTDLWIPRHLHDQSDDSQSASVLRADRDSGYDWGDRDLEGRSVTCRMTRGDYIDIHPYDTLVVDVQGYEGPVLRGFGELIHQFNNISVECSATPIYKGGAPATYICDYLWKMGFKAISKIEAHDDIFFVRKP